MFYNELKNVIQILVNNNFPNKLIDQQIKQYLHNIHKNSKNINNNNTNRINLFYKNEMHIKTYKVNGYVISNIIHRHLKPTEPQKQIKLIIYIINLIHPTPLKKKTYTNVVYKFICPFQQCF